MCFGGGNASVGINRQQQQQQSLINSGLQQLNSIFYGGQYGTSPATGYKAGTPYFTAGGQPYQFDQGSPDFLNFKKQYGKSDVFIHPQDAKGAVQGPAQAEALQNAFGNYLAKTGGLYTQSASSPGFGPGFYKQAQDAYVNFALPQLQGQYDQTRRGLDYRLANQGLLGSSGARDLTNQLGNQMVLNKQNIANQGLGQAQQLQRDVNQQYNTLVGQLEASANPTATTQQALQAAAQFSAPSALPAVGQLFNNFANQYLGGQLGGLYGQQAGLYDPRMNPALRGFGSGASAPVATYVG